jgi:hypothetical protein
LYFRAPAEGGTVYGNVVYPPGANTPCSTALVNVYHNPASLDPSGKETWYAWPDSTPTTCSAGTPSWVGTLFDYKKNEYVNVGQFSTPFFIVIQRLN